MAYSYIHNQDAIDEALALCKGSYQRDLLLGDEAISGATLRGTARRYGDRYKQSAKNLMRRIENARSPVTEKIGDHNRRELHIG